MKIILKPLQRFLRTKVVKKWSKYQLLNMLFNIEFGLFYLAIPPCLFCAGMAQENIACVCLAMFLSFVAIFDIVQQIKYE